MGTSQSLVLVVLEVVGLVVVPVKIERDEPVRLRNYGLETSKSFSGCVDVGLGRMKLRPQVLFTFSHPVQIPRRRQTVTYSKVVLTPPKYLQGLYIYYVIAKGGKGVWRTPIFDYVIHCNTKLLQKFLARICHILVISHQTVPTISKISKNWRNLQTLEKSPRIGEISKNWRNLQE